MESNSHDHVVVNALFHDREASEEKGTPMFYRVLYIEPTGRRLVAFALPEKAGNLPLWFDQREFEAWIHEGRLTLQTADPFLPVPARDEQLSAKERDIRDAHWKKIQSLVDDSELRIFDPRARGGAIAAAAKEHGSSRMTLYRMLRRFWQGGQVPNALLPRYRNSGGAGKQRAAGAAKRGRPSLLAYADSDRAGINIAGDVHSRLIRGIKRFVIEENMPRRRAYLKTLESYFASEFRYDEVDGAMSPVIPEAHEVPTLAQFTYWAAKMTGDADAIRKRVGERRYNLRHRPVLGTSADLASGPGAQYQVDATVGDIYLLSSLVPGRIIGRPVIYLVVDVFSQMIAGFYVGLEGPSWPGMMMTLQNAFSDKVEFCRSLGREIDDGEWPCRYLPQQILGDRGELISKNADHLVKGLGITVLNAPAFRPDWKALVERSFRTLNDEAVKFQPGFVHKARERGDPDYRLDATLTLRDFNKMMLVHVLHHNHHRTLPETHIPARFPGAFDGPVTPIQLWQWGTQHRSGHPRAATAEQIRLHLMPQSRARITAQGLFSRGMHYVPEELLDRYTSDDGALVRDPSSARIRAWAHRNLSRKTTYIDVAYDPREAGWIYPIVDGMSRAPCCLKGNLREMYTGMSFDEVKDARNFRKLNEQNAQSSGLQNSIDYIVELERLTKAASQRLDEQLSSSKLPMDVKGIREARADERRANRATETFRLGQANQMSEPVPAADPTNAPERLPVDEALGPDAGLTEAQPQPEETEPWYPRPLSRSELMAEASRRRRAARGES